VRIFTRYILREITGYALLGGVLFTFILFMRYLLPLMELTVRGVASPLDILRLIAYLLPSFLSFTIPMAVLVGILLGLSRLAADSEVTAMRASGVGVLSFVRIVSIFAVFFWALGLVNSLVIAPRAAQALLHYEDVSKTSQATVQIQPRVFYEDFKNYVLYAQDVIPGAGGTAIWRHVFLADLTKPANPHIITANQATVLSGGPQTLRLDLSNGSRHDISLSNPDQYDISTFLTTELPMQTGQQEEDSHLSRRDTPMHALGLRDLWTLAHTPGPAGVGAARPYLIELHDRIAFPTACLVLMLVGVPIGLSSKRGGKGAGFVVTLGLVFVYYFLSTVGIALARQDKVPPALGVWGANILFALAGLLLLQQLSRGGAVLELFASIGHGFTKLLDRIRHKRTLINPPSAHHLGDGAVMQRIRRSLRIRFPLILDEYVMGSFLRNFALVLVSLVVLFVIFTFFELIGDILRYRTSLSIVGDYLLNLIPFILNSVLPLCALVAVLITFGALNRNSELTAMKATGISLYRIVAPMLVVATLLSALLFVFDETYLPAANRRQESLLSIIKGKPAQTFLRPDRKWMSGQSGSSLSGQTGNSMPGQTGNSTPGHASRNNEPTRIFYYQFFDPDRNVFANLTVFEFQPGSFNLTRRIFAQSVRWDDKLNDWVFEDGWQRTFQGESISGYQPFTVATFPEIHEQPSYFKKEDRQSEQMSYTELASYIQDLKQSGFDTMRLRVQLSRKLAYPLMTLVLAILAIPFSLYAGKRSSIAGVGTAIGVAICYWVIAGIFENLGDVNSLPAVLAAWSPDLLFAIAGTYLLLRTPT
jgi:LPS export ABC transporter permease LptF/LPS export ABC transporter permease LptG